jgi:hypothetical protein
MRKIRSLAAGFIFLSLFLLLNFLSGCSDDKTTRSLYVEYQLHGTWEEEYTIGYYQPSLFEWGEDIWVEKDFISLIKFENDSYNLKIFDGQDSLLIERSSNFHILGDTVFFSVVYNDSVATTKTLGYKFISEDSLSLHSISYPVNDNYFTIELLGFAWEFPFTYDFILMYGYCHKNSGIFIRK